MGSACLDIDLSAAKETAYLINDMPLEVDVANAPSLFAAIDRVEADLGPIDLFVSNAGVLLPGGFDAPDADWALSWEVNVMAHVWAARHLVPLMIARGGGYFLNVASAAGLLNQIGSAPYGVTKHAAVCVAEWLAITHWDDGIKASVLCPQAVRTPMIAGHEEHAAAADGLLTPDDVANAAIAGIQREQFLILTHPQVYTYMHAKAADYDRWIAGMRKLNRQRA